MPGIPDMVTFDFVCTCALDILDTTSLDSHVAPVTFLG